MCCAEYPEEEYLQLSGIQHFAFCSRQWALIHIENQWAENVLTVSGEYMHERVHDAEKDDMRDGVLRVRGMPVSSSRLGISGACDVVEFYKDEEGVHLQGRAGLWRPLPVEYKRGTSKQEDCDRLQLCLQAMCLEEMLLIPINQGAIFYGETRRREQVMLDGELKAQVGEMLSQMHQYFKRGYTPKPKKSKRCQSCSLKDDCLPTLARTLSVEAYFKERLKEDAL